MPRNFQMQLQPHFPTQIVENLYLFKFVGQTWLPRFAATLPAEEDLQKRTVWIRTQYLYKASFCWGYNNGLLLARDKRLNGSLAVGFCLDKKVHSKNAFLINFN